MGVEDANGLAVSRELHVANASAARARRSLARCQRMFAAVAHGDGVDRAHADAAAIVGSLAEIELLAGVTDPDDELHGRLQSVVTHSLVASDVITAVGTSFQMVALSPADTRLLIAAIGEALNVVENSGDPLRGLEVGIEVRCDAGLVTLEVQTGWGAGAVLSRAGSDSMVRLGHLAAECGGHLRRGVRDGCLNITLSIPALGRG